jgi:hypothetical protein
MPGLGYKRECCIVDGWVVLIKYSNALVLNIFIRAAIGGVVFIIWRMGIYLIQII